jgi:hypothetical protein
MLRSSEKQIPLRFGLSCAFGLRSSFHCGAPGSWPGCNDGVGKTARNVAACRCAASTSAGGGWLNDPTRKSDAHGGVAFGPLHWRKWKAGWRRDEPTGSEVSIGLPLP